MRYDHFSMLPERAFQPRNGRTGMTLEGGSGGGGSSTSTTYTSNIPEWLRPQTEALLGAATKEYFNTKINPQTGLREIQSIKPYEAYSQNAEDYVAGFTPLQEQTFGELGGMETPEGFQTGSGYMGQAARGGVGTASTALGYGGMGAEYGGRAADIGELGLGYQGYGTDIGRMGMGYGQQAAGMGGLYEQMATSPESMQAYMSPYTRNVIEQQKESAIRDAQRANLAGNLGAVRQGTYGGSRQLLAQMERERALGSQLGQIEATGLQSAYDRAQQAQQFGVTAGLQGLQGAQQGLGTALQGGQLGLQGLGQGIAGQQAAMQGAGLGLQGVTGAQAGYGLGMQAGKGMSDIATAQQTADLARLQAQGTVGATQQQREQAIINQRIQDYAMQQQYPFQQLAGYSGLLRGYATPTTTVSQYNAYNPVSQLAGLGTTAAGIYGMATGKAAGGAINESDIANESENESSQNVEQYAEGGIASLDQKVLKDPTSFSADAINKGIANNSISKMVGAIGLDQIATARNQADQAAAATEGAPEGTVFGDLQQRAMGIDSLPTNLPTVNAAGGGIVAFEDGGEVIHAANGLPPSSFGRSDVAGQGITEPLPGESYMDYLVRRARESMRGPIFSDQGTMPGAGMSEAQYDALNKSRANQTLFGDILSGKAPVPVRSADPALMRDATPPGYYADETSRGIARRVATGGAGRSMEELGIGATEAAAKRAADQAAKNAPVATAPAAAQEGPEDFLARRKRMLEQAGVSADPFAEDRAANAAMREQLGKDREKAFNMALIEAGLGIMGGTSSNALRNIGEGAKGALGTYGRTMRELKADEKEFAKIDRDLRKSEDALKRGDVDKALEYEDKAKQREIQLRGVQAQERAAARPSSVNEVLAALQSNDPKVRAAAEKYLGAAKTGQVDERFLREQWSKMKPLDKMLLERQGIKSFEQWAASQGYPVGGAAGAPAAGGRVIDFGSIR